LQEKDKQQIQEEAQGQQMFSAETLCLEMAERAEGGGGET